MLPQGKGVMVKSAEKMNASDDSADVSLADGPDERLFDGPFLDGLVVEDDRWLPCICTTLEQFSFACYQVYSRSPPVHVGCAPFASCQTTSY